MTTGRLGQQSRRPLDAACTGSRAACARHPPVSSFPVAAMLTRLDMNGSRPARLPCRLSSDSRSMTREPSSEHHSAFLTADRFTDVVQLTRARNDGRVKLQRPGAERAHAAGASASASRMPASRPDMLVSDLSGGYFRAPITLIYPYPRAWPPRLNPGRQQSWCPPVTSGVGTSAAAGLAGACGARVMDRRRLAAALSGEHRFARQVAQQAHTQARAGPCLGYARRVFRQPKRQPKRVGPNLIRVKGARQTRAPGD